MTANPPTRLAAAPLWSGIRDRLKDDIATRHRPGDRLPTEADLAARFGVNRHTVRRALAALAEAGLVQARRGAGVFVTARPTDYRIGRRVRFSQNLAEAGQAADKRVLRLETRPAEPREAEALHLAPTAPVVLWEGVSLADDVPIALFLSVFPAERLPGLADALGRTRSVTAALAAAGVPDYTRSETRLSAEAADAVQAGHLWIAAGAPLLRSVGVNVDGQGMPVEYGRTWFAGDRVQLLVVPD